MAHDNVAVLTQSHSAIAAKKRAKHARIKEIAFDEDDRRSFLTGFHKRKVARREHAKKKAQLREKQERLETRREHRRALAERAARNAAAVESTYGAVAEGDDGEWDGVTSELGAEYEGEEQLATVTVVQDLDLSTLIHGPAPVRGTAQERGEEGKRNARVKKAAAKVQYETKAARLAEGRMQRARRTEKAERAGRRRK